VIRTVLAISGGLLRGSLRFVLSAQPDIDVVAELDAIDSVADAVRTIPPEVTVLDVDSLRLAAGADVLTAVRAACAGWPDSKVLVLVDPRRPGIGGQLADAPATIAFLAHDVAPERVVDAVRRLARGEPVVDAELVIAALRPGPPLTTTELRVLEVAALGTPVKDIASRLSLSPGTVRNHLSRVIAKTGARNRIEAIYIARQSGWI
jgi:two-component system response regulator DesR